MTAGAAPHEGAARHPRTFVAGVCGRLVRGVAAGMVVAAFVALADVTWAQRAADTVAPWFRLWLSDWGLQIPAATSVALIAAGFGLLLEPERARAPIEIVRALAGGEPDTRRRRFAVLLCIGPLLMILGTGLANLARLGFSAVEAGGELGASADGAAAGAALAGAPAAGASGATASVVTAPTAALVVAFGAVALAAVVVLGGLSLVRLIERYLPHTLSPRAVALAPAIGALLGAAVLTYGIVSGTTGGEGGMFAIWGVLKRPELDLRGPALVLAIAVAGLLGPGVLSRLPWAFALGLLVLPWGATARAAVALNHDDLAASSIERGAPLGRTLLKVLRRVSDRDGDGASPWFGGGDCNDHDPGIGPLAIDLPANGIDEDCSGEDAVPPPSEPASVGPASVKTIVPDLNLVLITVDTLRADLGYAGYPKPISPRIDELAARSVVFDRAYSLASYTGKSVGPLLIGKYPSETHRNYGHFNSFSREDTFIAERLHAAGIRTLSVQAHWYFGKSSGMSRGFDVLDMSAEPAPGLQGATDATITGDKLTAAALRVLGDPENTSSRFFVWMHYVDPHADYMHHPGIPSFGNGMRAAYDGEIYFTDQQIGKILDFMAQQPWGKKTAVIITADHGEAFGEHHMIRHGFELWEPLVHVPLVIYVPFVHPHHIAARRSAIDLVPTILDLMQVPAPTGQTPSDFVSGRSLSDDLFLPKGYTPDRRDILIDMPEGPYNEARRAFIHDDLKLYVSGGTRLQLFDLANDPEEAHDVYADKALRARILPVYRAFETRLREVVVKPTRR